MAHLPRTTRGMGTVTSRYLLRIAKARIAEIARLKASGISKRALEPVILEASSLRQRGEEMQALGSIASPVELQADAWTSVAHVMATAGNRTRLMAARMVVERTDPVPDEPPDDRKAKPPLAIQVNLGVLVHTTNGAGNGNGHAGGGADPGPELRPGRIAIHLGGGVRPSA